MKRRVSPAVAAAALAMLLVVLYFYGRQTLAEPPSAIGFITVNGVTREMTRQEAINMGLAMQGKAHMPAGMGKISRPGTSAGLRPNR